MRFVITVERDEAPGTGWVIRCPSIPGCVSQGETQEEALRNIGDAIRACLEVRAAQGMPLSIEVRTVDIPLADVA